MSLIRNQFIMYNVQYIIQYIHTYNIILYNDVHSCVLMTMIMMIYESDRDRQWISTLCNLPC